MKIYKIILILIILLTIPTSATLAKQGKYEYNSLPNPKIEKKIIINDIKLRHSSYQTPKNNFSPLPVKS